MEREEIMFKYDILEKLDKTRRYKLACGHNNIGIINLWPFKTWVCLECGFKTERIEVVGENKEIKGLNKAYDQQYIR